MKTTARVFVLAVVFFLLLACGSAPAALTSTPQTTSSPEVEQQTPGDAGELLDQAVATGAISLEDALVAYLKMLANEEPLPASLQGEFGSTDVYEVFVIAEEYLVSGEDEIAKEEIERLLESLHFSSEELQKMSEPDPEAIRLNTSLLAKPVAQCGVGECLWFLTFTAGGQEVNIYYPSVPDAVRGEWWRPYVDEVRVAVGSAMARYASMGIMRKVDVVFRPNLYLPDMTALAMVPMSRLSPEGSCVMEIFVSVTSEPGGIPQFKNTVSHELFHCYQVHNYYAQALTPYSAGSSKWWVESTAELYGNLLYPSTRLAYDTGLFDSAVLTGKTLLDMPYHGFVFFHYLQSQQGDEGINRFMAAMPTATALNEQRVAFHNLSGMPFFFQEFAQDYFQKNMSLPVNPPTFTPVSFAGADSLTSFVKSMQIISQSFTYAPAVGFGNTVSISSGLGFLSFSPDSTGLWQNLPNQIGKECNPRTYLGVFSSTDPDVKRMDWNLNVAVNETATCVADSCLVGTWTISGADYMAPIRETYPPSSGVVNPDDLLWVSDQGDSGSVKYTFTSEGVFEADIHLQSSFLASAVGTSQNVRISINLDGGGTATYTLPSPGIVSLQLANPSDFVVTSEVKVLVAGVPYSTSANYPMVANSDIADYSCGENYLIYSPRPIEGRPPMTWQFTKVSP